MSVYRTLSDRRRAGAANLFIDKLIDLHARCTRRRVVTENSDQAASAAFKRRGSTMNSFDQLVSTLAEFQAAVTAEDWTAKAFAPPPPRISLAPPIAALRRMQGQLATMTKAQAVVKPTRDEVRARVREGVAQVMAKALAAQKAGTVTGLEVVRLEAQAMHLVASV